MKRKMSAERPAHSRSYLRHKLVSAAALLLVSSIMLVSTSYAWYVLSTAPEVSNIKTQVGANGALEIALLNADSWADLSKLDMGDIDESITDPDEIAAAVANLTWGNLVNLDDRSYGMDGITLNPARLNISQDGNDYKVGTVLLKTPVYGEDGRIKDLETTSVAYTYDDGSFSKEADYGVRAVGTSSNMSVFQLGMIDARNKVSTHSADARTAARTALESTGGDLASIVVAFALNKQSTDFTRTDVMNVQKLAAGMQSALGEIETALRYVFAGYITTADAAYDADNNPDGITADNYQARLTEITNTGEGKLTLNQLLLKYSGIEAVVAGTGDMDDIGEYINKLTACQTSVNNAYNSCQAKLDSSATSFTWADDLAPIIYPLVDTDKMTVAGMTVPELKAKVEDENSNLGDLLNEVMDGGGLTVTVPSGSGILSDIADFAGDYWAEVTVAKVSYGTINMDNVTATMQTKSGFNPVHLTDCSNKMQQAESAESTENAGITDFYGYAIDLAFRTNATESNLLLQTEPENRVYQGANQPGLQGGGSYMSFTASGDLSATKMVRLMKGIRVVFMDGSQKVLAIAALDTELGQNNYEVLDPADQTTTGMYAYLKGGAGDYQNSDLIDATTYNNLDPTSDAVTFNEVTGKVTAKLYLYEYELAKRYIVDEEGEYVLDEEGNQTFAYTGGLNLGNKLEDGVISALLQDVPQKVTALVYLDGSFVNNSSVAAEAMYSMTGNLNLQFSSSANLLPVTNTKLQTDTSGVVYTELTGSTLYDSGYLKYNEVLCKVNSGYKICEGSDGKLYIHDTAYVGDNTSEAYTELTDTSYTTALTPVTVSLSADENSIAVEGTATLTAALSDSSLTNVTYTFTKTGDDGNAIVVHTVSGNTATVTGKAAGEVTYQVTAKVDIGDAGSVTLQSETVTVTVTAAGGSDEGEGS